MRKELKEQILQILTSIENVHQQLEALFRNGDVTQAAGCLEDCQNAAIAVGTQIEQSEGEGTEAVRLLEEYCELVYTIHESILVGEKKNSSEFMRTLKTQMEKVKESVNNKIQIKKKVVFLPYKASMWDSLESVYKKCCEDPACDAKVVPIPYFDKNPDGSARAFHYEIDQYPEDIPVIHYEKYNLKEEHPDEIYIHNPYDDRNFVTSVHPYFYSDNLREYTDKLIYIPYFVLAEPDPNNAASVENIAHFAQTPGVVHADEVWVQSENMRLCYIEALVQMFGEETRASWEKKIIAYHSPKFDKVANTRREDVKLPEEWIAKIKKTDGSNKKVILYNTSVSALLKSDEKMIHKIERVFEIFYENREQVALLWRPHPLIEATISSMRPKLYEAYSALVQKYREEDWGIYDDSPYLDRAIVISDAYYGDGSSIVQLCQSVGMPIMIQNVDV